MTARQRRSARGAAATGVAVLFGAVSHTYGGGTPPGPWIVLAVALLAWPIATVLAARRLRLGGVAAGALCAQVLLHAAFAVTDGAAPVPGTGHHHDVLLPSSFGAALSLPDTPMLLAHGLAAVTAFVVLAFGSRALGAVDRGIRTAVRRATIRAARPAAVRGATSTALPAPPSHPAYGTIRRRGPPRSLALRAS